MGSPTYSGEQFAPRATGVSGDVDLQGKVFPWGDGQPVLLSMPMSEWRYLPVFSTAHELSDFMAQASVPYVSIKRIDDHSEFLFGSTPPGDVKIITNVRFTESGTVKFLQVEVVA